MNQGIKLHKIAVLAKHLKEFRRLTEGWTTGFISGF